MRSLSTERAHGFVLAQANGLKELIGPERRGTGLWVSAVSFGPPCEAPI